ncbi:hypothetical protein EHEL_091090 [Encephalitozoon hellem ATCC 50504]|uniref:RING finger protein 25 n=1 Tax=Encephalitozoon hellem TaxID=27973 RepID=A0A9Q9FC95_ENCHE|nr:uncharacterized protein EHEL_091090 [Encephalitozoon hellem ATCC 50504]AFM99004.1 hypothetical protein EHEL_091090 [Encephalitozoon hellem ATCC 50504]UTX44020.1 RING finger protein 25 [Encephalitozoon hellem]WEL39505.1 RWD domain-containing protein [Encephalitozoon hellem]|eukprot:XP_003887985.1 hypothetical protein EHEL_091090 [Encephalitozoon hellem ATCC 50504]
MDEHDALEYIFGSNLRHCVESTGQVYKISIGDKYFEFSCGEDYPYSIPRVISNVENEVLEDVAKKAKSYVSTPMIFDMIRLTFKKLEESNIEGIGKRISACYIVDDRERITEEDFLNWRKKNQIAVRTRSGKTGKEIFLERKRNREEIQDDI